MLLSSDSTPETDLLDRENFSKQIVDGLIRTARLQTAGFVTALTGKWGSGKSTLLCYVKRDLMTACNKEDFKFSIWEFNPWMFADKQDISKVFLKEFAKRLRSKNWWRSFVLRVSGKLKYAKIINAGAGEFGKEIGDMVKAYLDADTPLALKKEIDKLLVKRNQKIFILIDDIDRLSPKQVFELLQVLKLTGNFKNTYYIIAYDREAVELSIESQFKNYGKKYLDKIVQADFLIPEPPEEKIESIFFKGLEELCTDYNVKYSTSSFSSIWLHMGIRQYFLTLRDIHRYLNSLQFSLPGISDEIDVTDFLVLEAIRLHDFEAYQKIYDYTWAAKYLYGSTNSLSSDEGLKNFENTTTKKLIKFLFPQQGIGKFKNVVTKRLFDPENSSKYFTLKLSSKDISEVEFNQFMEVTTARVDFLKRVSDFGRLDNLLIRLNDSGLSKHYENWDFALVEDLFKFFTLYCEQIGGNNIPLSDAIVNLLHQKPKEKSLYFNYFIQLLLRNTQEVDNARIYFYHFMLESKEKDNGFPYGAVDFKEFYLKKYQELLDYYLSHLRNHYNYFLGGEIPKPFSYYTLLAIYDYATFLPQDYVNRFSELIKNEKNLLFFLTNIMFGTGETIRIDSNMVNKLLPRNLRHNFIQQVKRMDITLLTDNQRKLREIALEHFNESNLESQ